jgi:hypothetical protein
MRKRKKIIVGNALNSQRFAEETDNQSQSDIDIYRDDPPKGYNFYASDPDLSNSFLMNHNLLKENVSNRTE